jgi:iron complex outermembrane receptor protein
MNFLSIIGIGLLVVSSIASAQIESTAEIEEIVVTADYRQASINDISTSITVLTDKLIQRKGAQHLEDLLADAANVNLSSGASRARFYQIRGIGERGQFSEPLNPSVGVIIDGVDFSGIGNAATLYDVEQVEILMGPQGTRYGSNALAGLINLKTKSPTEEFVYGLQADIANYDGKGIAGYISGPMTDKLLYRLSVQTLSSDGFSENLFLNKPTNKRKETTFRGKLGWTLSDNVSMDFNAAVIDIDNGYDAFSLDNVRDTLSDEPGFDRQDSKLLSTKLTADNFEKFSLEAIVGYANSDIEYGYDEDWGFVGFHPWEYSSTDQYLRGRDTLSGEIRLVSNENGTLFSDSTSWVAGIYSLQQNVDLTRIYTYLSEDFTSAYDIDRLSVFAESNTTLTDNWSFDLGLRAERFDASYLDSELSSFAPDENLYGGKIALNYRTNKNNLVYMSASRGYKTGGFNIDGTLDEDLREFDAELLWNYEVGFKGFLFDDRLETQLAVFYMDRDDVQISSSTLRLRPDGSTEFIEYVGNAASGFNYGLELTSSWLANDYVTVYGSLGLLKSEYQDFVNSAGEDMNGREQAHAPNYQFTLGTDISITQRLVLNLNLQGKDEFYFSDSHDFKSDAYSLFNASLIYSMDHYSLTLWGRNLTDEDYYVRGFFFGNDPRNGYTAKGYTQLGEPLRFGLTLRMDF